MTIEDESPKVKLMIEISPELYHRLEVVVAEKNLSIDEYIEHAIERAVSDEPRPMSRESLERLLRARERMMEGRGGRPFSDSTEIIRQMREERSQYLGEL